MNRDEICRMAEESTPDQMIGGFEFDYEQLLHFAALVAAAEREACAKVCDELEQRFRKSQEASKQEQDQLICQQRAMTSSWCAGSIRAREE